MKKNCLLLAVLLTCLCVCAAATAEMTAVPSPKLSVAVTQVAAKDGKEVPPTLVIDKIEYVAEEMPAATADLFEQLKTTLVLSEQAQTELGVAKEQTDAAEQPQEAVKVELTEFFPQETVEAVAAVLPVEKKMDDLVITEFIPLQVANYQTEIGDVQTVFTVPGEYSRDKAVVAMVGVWDGEKMVWFVPELIVVEGEMGELQFSFTAEMLEMMNSRETVLLILNET